MTDVLNTLALVSNFIIVPGLAYGSQLALGALGITIVYAVLRFSNFAHGEMMSFGAMITILVTWVLQARGINLGPLPTALLALPLGIAATIGLCLVTDRLVYRYYRQKRASPVTYLIVSVGVMFLMGGLIRFVIGPNDQIFADGARFIMKAKEFKQMTGLNEGLAIKSSQGVTVLTAVVIVVVLFWFLNRTRTGKSMRAYSDNEDLALLSGINPEQVVLIAWIIAGTLAAVAGTLYGLDKSYKPFTFLQLLLPIFASAIVGGVGNPLGAIAGGFVIAFSELIVTFAYKKVLGYLLPTGLAPEGLAQLLSTDYKFSVSFMILVIVLLVKPTGLFSGKTL
ncbi:MAG: branched-chain amino acid ABC transporter permease [Arenicellales bacterium]|jgi:branched-chain amino acid transport system permease protein|nr:branched-chain amino acid ABC transporter permease [Arenicellales bacterium]MDP6291013.1 branched-chain amino acid ABC transporter permease [Arenicellales bacterium]MDP7191676.1 branched-chain amino acid ABC transporter permease [Arenicellales bacterium]